MSGNASLSFEVQKTKDGKETGYTKVNVESKGKLDDINFQLLSSMATAKEKYLYEVSDNVTGIDRNTGNEVTGELGHGDKTRLSVALNLSTTARGDDEKNYNNKRYPLFNAMPAKGFDAHIVLSTNTNSVYYRDASNDNKDTPVPRHVLLFHEMAESYYRTTGRKDFKTAHNGAERAEAANPNARALPGYLINGVPNFGQKR
jgi:hypothetical protein